MLPICYPSSPSPTTGLPEAVAYALSSVSGLTRWVDYIPVKLVGSPLGMNEQTTNLNGFVPMRLIGSAIGMAAWSDYIPVYVDNSATEAWVTSATGYIPYANSVLGATTPSVPSFYFNFSNPQNVTLGAAQARGTITSTQNAVISASVSPSRTTGVAPLYVNFDATGTTSTLSANPSHELFFATDFGDYSAGVWANGVQSAGLTSKNAGYGPVTGHVYETPGTYTVQMVVTDGVNTAVKTGTVVVQDPNVVYDPAYGAGYETICISNSNNFTGAPGTGALPGVATYINRSGDTDMYAAWNTYKASNKRILFCKADTWVASAPVSVLGLAGTTLSGYGNGAAHTFASGTLVRVTPAAGIGHMLQGGGSTDCRICSFKIAADATHIGVAVTTADSVALTLYKIEVWGATAGFSSTPSTGAGNLFKQDQHCIYECLSDQQYGYAFSNPPAFIGASGAVGTPGVFTATGHKFNRYNKVRLFGSAPTGLSTGTDYYISATNLTANTFSLSSTFNTDTPLAISVSGSCDVTSISPSGGVGAFVAMSRGGFMGNYLDSCNLGEQTVRMPYLNTVHVNNNYLARPNQTKNVLKIHCRGYNDISNVSSGYSEKIVVTANCMDLRGGYSYNAAIPNNGQTAVFVGACAMVIGNGGISPGGERVRNVIVQNNLTHSSLGNPKDKTEFIEANCPNMTLRNNIADFSMGDRVSSFSTPYAYASVHFAAVATSTTEQTSGVRIYNNTLYSNIFNAELATFVQISYAGGVNPEVNDVQIRNNLWYVPHHNALSPASTREALGLGLNAAPTNVTSNAYNTDTVAGGLAKTSPNFVNTPPVLLADWRPNTGSYAIDSGATVPVLKDFNMATRTGTYDLGAVLP